MTRRERAILDFLREVAIDGTTRHPDFASRLVLIAMAMESTDAIRAEVESVDVVLRRSISRMDAFGAILNDPGSG